jgi:hypothetical protein
MTLTRSVLLLAAAAFALAACSKSTGGAQTAANASSAGAPPAAAAPSSGPDTTIAESDLPHPKAGMWQVSSSVNGAPAHVSQSCYKGEPLRMNEHPVPGCTGMQLKRTFTGDYVMDASCAQQGFNSTMHIVVHGDFLGGSYQSNGKVHIEMPGRPPLDMTTHSDAHWLGPC